MSMTVVHPTCLEADAIAAEVVAVLDRFALAVAGTPERACPSPEELAALADVTVWLASDEIGADARRRLRWLVLSGLERTARAYLAASDGRDSTVDARTGAPAERQWAASTVAALLTIRLTSRDPEVLHAALGTVVEHAGPDDLWALLVETARTWGPILALTTQPNG